jgi:diguanylate cyclase (GGDEF)-like protein
MKILVADDDPVTRRVLQVQLQKWGHEVVTCADGAEAWDILTGEDTPRLVILDWMMPGIDGVNICRNIRKLEQQPYIYLILLTSKSRTDEIVEGLEAGADDYITKPFNPNELKVRIRAGARIIQLQEELMAALRASEYQAAHDGLTGLLNRTAILKALQVEFERSRRDSTRLATVIADIDFFKQINDRWGHLAGDAVLVELTKRIASSLRPYDAAGRYGGEEFIVLLPGCNQQTASKIAERLRSLVAEAPVATASGLIHCTMSFGVAAGEGSAIPDIDSLIRCADEALYRAKELGRNRVEPPPELTNSRKAIE